MTDPEPTPAPAPEPAGQSDQSEQDVDAVAEAVLAVPGVHSLHAGVLGEVATYLPGRRVGGVRLSRPGAEVHLVLAWGAPIGATTDEVRVAVRDLVGGPVEITVEDIAPRGAVPPDPQLDDGRDDQPDDGLDDGPEPTR